MHHSSFRRAAGVASPSAVGVLFIGLACGLLLAATVAFFAWPAGDAGPAEFGAGGEGGGPGAGAAGPPPAPVEVVAAVETVAAELMQLLATAAPVRESLVASEVDGLVVSLAVDEGSSVGAGDVLVSLRTATVEQELAAARAAEQETRARLARAEADFERLSRLLDRGAISRSEYDQAVADRDALARGVERLQAEVAQLDDQLQRASLRAPFAGLVSRVDVEVGEWVGRGDAILTLVDLSEIEVRVPVAERFISAVEPGFPVAVTFDALPGERFEGRVKSIIPQAVPEARSFPVLVGVRNPRGLVKPGMAARIVAQLGDPQPAVLVAKDAIVRRGSQTFVMRVAVQGGPPPAGAAGEAPADGAGGAVGTVGMVEQVPVVVGQARGGWFTVQGGVAHGDLLIVRGNERVFPGQPVQVSAVRDLPVPEADSELPIATDPRQGSGS